MKTLFICLAFGLLTIPAAYSQVRSNLVMASLETIGGTTDAGSLSGTRETTKALHFIQPVTIRYKEAPWHLMLVDGPDEKQVVHFTKEQVDRIVAILEKKDGKTHYLEVTNFHDVYAGAAKAEVNQQFLSSMATAIRQKHWYKNNAVFMVSSLQVGEQHVVRFKLPFSNEQRVCRHVKAMHNLKEGYYETSPTDFMKLLLPETAPTDMSVSTSK
ncbi:hypothetical protein [Pontibacter roseus]|uniref:hypothetical protein n=1 Tax=Pontibacter roseus TaxID=336989 RepID=UPI0003619A74|nr:hypothetical protein [Pontibacter roseus]